MFNNQFLSLELPKHAKASGQGQTLVHAEAFQEKNAQTPAKNLISSLNRRDFGLARFSRLANELKQCA